MCSYLLVVICFAYVRVLCTHLILPHNPQFKVITCTFVDYKYFRTCSSSTFLVVQD